MIQDYTKILTLEKYLGLLEKFNSNLGSEDKYLVVPKKLENSEIFNLPYSQIDLSNLGIPQIVEKLFKNNIENVDFFNFHVLNFYNSKLNSLLGNSQIYYLLGNSHINNVSDSCIGNMQGNSSIDNVINSRIDNLLGSSNIASLKGESNITKMQEFSVIQEVRGDTIIGEMRGNSRILSLEGRALVKKMKDLSQIDFLKISKGVNNIETLVPQVYKMEDGSKVLNKPFWNLSRFFYSNI